MGKFGIVFLSALFVFGIGIGTASAKKDKNPPGCGELGECAVAADCEAANPDLVLHPCEQWGCNADQCCEVDTTGCPTCYGDFQARVLGGGAGSKKIDRQVAVYFLVYQSAGIVDATDDSITVCEPTILTGTVYDGQGPNPSTITYNGEAVNVDAGGVFLLEVGAGGTFYLDNLDNGGRDIDQITINTTTVNP